MEITLSARDPGAEALRAMADAGVGRALVKPWDRGREAVDGLRRFADQVLPQLSGYPVAGPTT